jgi:light-regulated signal transduction histidine kinase (bacteriophytochrome)/CheY-like chemotaxis protein
MVDDQPSKLLSYEVILSELGETLIRANSGREALEHLLKTDIAVVLMDVSMPEIDGFELAEIIRQHPRYQQTAIIFISAVHLTEVDQIKGYAHGAVDYISVPVIPDLLRAKVSVFAELYRKTRQLARLNIELEQRVAERTADLQRANEELVVLNTELKRSNQELDDFAYIASHDLREPLRGIHNYSHFLMEDYGDKLNVEATEQLQTLVRLSQRMEALIDSLLHYSRLNRADPILVEVNLTHVLQDAIEMLKPRIDGDSVQIRCPQVLPCVYGDRAQLTEVMVNLLSNALKYNDKAEKWVEIGVREAAAPSEPPVFFVRDNGIGIAPEHNDKVFEIFRRLHPRDDFGGGMGVGLTVVKKIVEHHGGHVWVESAVGNGTAFYFTIGNK